MPGFLMFGRNREGEFLDRFDALAAGELDQNCHFEQKLYKIGSQPNLESSDLQFESLH